LCAAFDLGTMEPLVDAPPFVRALTEIAGAYASGPSAATEADPAAVRRAFFSGATAMAVTWPRAGGETLKLPNGARIGYAALPGSPAMYHRTTQTWQRRAAGAPQTVPLLGIAGRIGSVLASPSVGASSAEGIKRRDAGFQFLIALSSGDWSTRVLTASSSTALFRNSQAASAGVWADAGAEPAAAMECAATLATTLDGASPVETFRLPGREEYLAALDRAVRQAVLGEKGPAEALHDAAAAWRAVTQRRGVDLQRAALRKSLGL
jgi:ABC-type glycerol-3-phosphate transport system substrate-binding protein